MSYWVHRNLHKHCWSVRRDGKSPTSHVDRLLLREVEFKVREAGRQRVLAERRKNVHAFAVGVDIFSPSPDPERLFGLALAALFERHGAPVRVTYDPYKWGAFMEEGPMRLLTPLPWREYVEAEPGLFHPIVRLAAGVLCGASGELWAWGVK